LIGEFTSAADSAVRKYCYPPF